MEHQKINKQIKKKKKTYSEKADQQPYHQEAREEIRKIK